MLSTKLSKIVSIGLVLSYLLTLESNRLVLADQGDFTRPAKGPIILHFHNRYRDPTDGKLRTHYGIDISSPEGSPAFVSASGKVSFAGFTPAGGQTVSITHPGGIKTTYLQLKEIRVSRGEMVSQGQLIGMVAREGDKSSSQSHLHMGASIGKIYIDPEELFSGRFRLDLSEFIRRGNIPPDFRSPGETNDSTAGFLKLSFTPTTLKGANLIAPKLLAFAEYLFAKLKTSKIVSKTFKLVRKLMSFLVRFGKSVFRQTRWLAKTAIQLTIKLFSWSVRKIKTGTRFLPLKNLLSDRFRLFVTWLGISGHGDRGVEPSVFDPSGDNEGNSRSRVLIPVRDGVLEIGIFNARGTLVKTIKDWPRVDRYIIWDGIGQNGDIAEEGVYTLVARLVRSRQKKIGQVEVRYHLK